MYAYLTQGWNCRGVEPRQFMSTDAHFWAKIGLKLQSLGKISNISVADPPVLLGQFQHRVGLIFATTTTSGNGPNTASKDVNATGIVTPKIFKVMIK